MKVEAKFPGSEEDSSHEYTGKDDYPVSPTAGKVWQLLQVISQPNGLGVKGILFCNNKIY